ncbi:MAG: hypothetical protein FJ197_05905 [Gammaproteobacteria bacterium]|nr:hypothetical protein [Gammaproteobacteria bacterium]
MRITAEISLYPLKEGFVAPILECIALLRRQPGIEVVTNQMSTQLRGEFDQVLAAVSAGMRAAMEQPGTVVFVVKCINADLPIANAPALERSA